MKVLHLIDSGGLYGAERMLLTLASEQRRAGVVPLLGSIGRTGEPEKPVERAARERGIEVWPIRMRRGLDLRGALRVVRGARRRQVDLLHTHGYRGDILMAVLPAAIRGIPWVVTTHGWATGTGSARARFTRWLDHRAIGAADRIIAVSEAMRSAPPFHRRRLAERTLVIPNAIERPRPTGDIDPTIAAFTSGGPTATTVGRLVPIKGHDILFDALANPAVRATGLRLLVLGDGPLRGALEERAVALGIGDRVRFVGFRDDVVECIAAADLFVMPSRSEGLPVALLEAVGLGVPVVASEVGGIPEALRAVPDGQLVPAGDVDALAGALVEAMATLPERDSRRPGSTGTHFDVEAMEGQYRRVYASVFRDAPEASWVVEDGGGRE